MHRQRLFTLVSVFALLTALFAPLGLSAAQAEATVINPGFEVDNDRTLSPTGWTITGTAGTELIRSGKDTLATGDFPTGARTRMWLRPHKRSTV